MAVKVDVGTCIGCGTYVDICPVSALDINDNGRSIYDERVCIDCGSCVSAYPVSAVSQ